MPITKVSELKAGDRCVDWSVPWTDLEVLTFEGGTAFTILRGNKRSTGQRIVLSAETKVFKTAIGLGELDEGAQATEIRVRHLARHLIGQSKDPLVNDIVERLRAHMSDAELAVGCLKYAIAIGMFSIAQKSKRSTKLVMRLSDEQKGQERQAEFSASFADEVKTQAERIETLIRHWPTVGSFREELLRALLQKNLPDRYHVATGFLFGSSRQLDVLIYDRIDHSPLFRAGDLVVVERSAARAVIEVKSVLNHADLRSALVLLDDVDTSLDREAPMFKGIFAYRSEMSTSAIIDTMVKVYNDDDIDTGAQLFNLRQIATAVCVQQKTLVLSGVQKADVKGEMFVPVLAAIESELERTPQVALFLDVLKTHLRGNVAATGSGLKLASFIEPELKRVGSRKVYGGLWGPYIARDYEEYDGADLRAEAKALERWRRGGEWKL